MTTCWTCSENVHEHCAENLCIQNMACLSTQQIGEVMYRHMGNVLKYPSQDEHAAEKNQTVRDIVGHRYPTRGMKIYPLPNSEYGDQALSCKKCVLYLDECLRRLHGQMKEGGQDYEAVIANLIENHIHVKAGQIPYMEAGTAKP